MNIIKTISLIGVAAAAIPASASTSVVAAATVMVGGVGSSAQFESASIAAYNLAGAGAGHYTLSNGGQIVDTREAGIANQTGNLSVIWNAAQTQVWYYLSVDSIVGNRAYFAQPRTTLNVPGGGLTAPSNSISASLWGTDATSVPTAVETAIQGSQFTAAFTDVLPADAEFAEQRVNCTGTPNLTGPPTSPLGGGTGPAGVGCLGYAPGAVAHVGQPILTAFNTGSSALPVDFNITGTDPITGNAIPAFGTIPLGVAPVIFIANKSNPNGLGAGGGATFTGLNTPTSAEELFSGANCNTNAFGLNNGINVAVNPILREPMSGTMNTAEFNIFVQGPPPTAGLYFSRKPWWSVQLVSGTSACRRSTRPHLPAAPTIRWVVCMAARILRRSKTAA